MLNKTIERNVTVVYLLSGGKTFIAAIILHANPMKSNKLGRRMENLEKIFSLEKIDGYCSSGNTKYPK